MFLEQCGHCLFMYVQGTKLCNYLFGATNFWSNKIAHSNVVFYSIYSENRYLRHGNSIEQIIRTLKSLTVIYSKTAILTN